MVIYVQCFSKNHIIVDTLPNSLYMHQTVTAKARHNLPLINQIPFFGTFKGRPE